MGSALKLSAAWVGEPRNNCCCFYLFNFALREIEFSPHACEVGDLPLSLSHLSAIPEVITGCTVHSPALLAPSPSSLPQEACSALGKGHSDCQERAVNLLFTHRAQMSPELDASPFLTPHSPLTPCSPHSTFPFFPGLHYSTNGILDSPLNGEGDAYGEDMEVWGLEGGSVVWENMVRET